MIDINHALVYDIETHRGVEWENLPKAVQTAFINHYYDPQSYDTPKDHYSEIAGLYAEFSQVICVSLGYWSETNQKFIKTSILGPNEDEILIKLSKTLKVFQDNGYFLVGFNNDTCDTPYLIKRYIIKGIKVPSILNTYGVKPWDLESVDVMKLWQMGDYKRTSLEMVSACMGINCKEGDLGGSNLYTWELKDMPWDKLKFYCEEDVESTFLVLKRILTYYDT